MKITIVDWCCDAKQLRGTKYAHGTEIDGTVDDAFRIAREIYDMGLNVMVLRCPECNVGTKKKPIISPEEILIGVDTKRFQQR